jgi:hypothetical protein
MTFADRNSRVVCAGHDEVLLRTRQMVLASRYQAVTVLGVEQLRALPAEEMFDVVLLCHTLSAEECRRVTEIARTRWPGAKVMAIATEQMGCVAFADQAVQALEGPRVLFRAIDQLLAAAPSPASN